MKVAVTFQLDDGRRIELAPGQIVGRMAGAAARIEDPRVSEAHALVSLRGAELKLLALRGRLSVDGKPKTDVVLSPGLRVTIAGYFGLTVVAIELPKDVLALIPVDHPDEAIGTHGVVAIFPSSPALLRPGFDPAAAAHVWSEVDHTVLRLGHQDETRTGDRRLVPGDTFEVEGRGFRLDLVPRAMLEARPTSDRGTYETRLKLILKFDLVRIHGADGRSVVLDGIAARMVSELYEIGAPIAWQEIARLLWPNEETGTTALRQRWDQLMTRVRMRLREAGIRSDLVRPSHRGLVELQLGPEDEVEDQT